MDINIRRAKESDREQILEISKTIWDGRDYILSSIDTWLDPSTGIVIIVEKDNEIRAFSKVTYMDNEIGWLEGLRVKEEYRGLGYAHLLTERSIIMGREENLKVLKFACHKNAKGSIKSSEKRGFKRKGEFIVALAEEPIGFRNKDIIKLKDSNLAYDIIKNSYEFKKNFGNFYGHIWKFIPITKSAIEDLILKGRVLTDKSKESILVYDIINDEVRILFYTGSSDNIKNLFNHLFELEKDRVFKTMIIPNTSYIGALEEIGFRTRGENFLTRETDAYLYEYILKK